MSIKIEKEKIIGGINLKKLSFDTPTDFREVITYTISEIMEGFRAAQEAAEARASVEPLFETMLVVNHAISQIINTVVDFSDLEKAELFNCDNCKAQDNCPNYARVQEERAKAREEGHTFTFPVQYDDVSKTPQ